MTFADDLNDALHFAFAFGFSLGFSIGILSIPFFYFTFVLLKGAFYDIFRKV